MKPGDFTPCLSCRRPVGETGGLTFYQVTLQRMAFDRNAIDTTLGLAKMVRSAALVEVFNPTPEIAKPLGGPEKFLLCDLCASDAECVAVLFEDASNRPRTDTTDLAASVSASGDETPPSGEAA